MKFELSNPRTLKTIIETLAYIVDESGISFHENGVSIRALDKSHITFMTVELKKYLFDEYSCESPEYIIVDVAQLSKIMKRCKNDDIIEWNIGEGNLEVTFKGDSTRKFNSRLIDNDYESPRPPILDYPCKINVPSTLFNDTLGDLKLFHDSMRISVDEDYINFRCEGMDGEGEVKYIHGENVDAYYKSQFSIEKLSEIMKAKDFSENIILSLGNDMPLRLTFELVTGDGRLEFLLAPRIEND